MNKLLINETPLVLLPTLVKLLGFGQATIVQQIHYAVQQPRSGIVLEDGEKYVWNTYQEWAEQYFIFWTPGMVKRQFRALENKGILVSCQPHKQNWDRTKYYRVDYAALEVLLNSECSMGDDCDPSEDDDCIPSFKETKTSNKDYNEAPPPPESTKPKPENPRFNNGKPQYQSNRSLSTSSALDSAPASAIIEATHEILKFQLPIPTQERIAEVVPAPLVREWCEMIKDRMCGREDDAANYLKRSIGYWLTDFKKSYRIQLAELESTPPPIPKAVLTLCDKCRHTSSMIRVDENVWTKCKHQ